MKKKMNRLFSLILAFALIAISLLAAGCGDGKTPADSTTGGDTSHRLDLSLGYTIVRSEDADAATMMLVSALRDCISARGDEISLASDWIEHDQTLDDVRAPHEILVGVTNRPESVTAAEGRGESEYLIRVCDDGTVVLYGTSFYSLYRCVAEFASLIGCDIDSTTALDSSASPSLGYEQSGDVTLKYGDPSLSPQVVTSPCGGDAPARAEFISDGVADGDLVVSPEGDDSAAGTLDAPLRTVAEAKSRLAAQGGDSPVTVWLRDGVYCQNEPLIFGESDRENVTYRAYNGEYAVISGGIEISSWEEGEINGYPVWIHKFDTPVEINTLYDDTGRLSTPRFPAADAPSAEDVKGNGWLTLSADYTDDEGIFHVDPATLEGFDPGTNEGMKMHIVHHWVDERVDISPSDIDISAGTITTQRRQKWQNSTGWAVLSAGYRFYFENVGSLIGAKAGEWFYSSEANTLYYAPREGEDITARTLYAGNMPTVVKIDGCDNITFTGIGFSHTSTEAIECTQAAEGVPAAITAVNASGIRFNACTVSQTGGYGIEFGENAHDSALYGCLICDLGAGGIHLSGSRIAEDDPAVISGIDISECVVRDYGKYYYEGVGVLIRYARESSLRHCEIHDGLYTGISVGWSWSYDPTPTDYITIENNLVYNIGDPGHTLSDGGGIYMLGTEKNTVVRGNIFFNSYLDHGIYLDESSTGVTVENNLAFMCHSSAMFMHYGMDNVIRNNIFAFSSNAVNCARTEERPGLLMSGNIFVSGFGLDTDSALTTNCNSSNTVSEGDLWWSYALPFASYAKKCVVDTINADGIFRDPGFTDAFNFDFSFVGNEAPDGFTAWDISAAGVTLGR